MIKIRCEAIKAIRILAIMEIVMAIVFVLLGRYTIKAEAQFICDASKQEDWRASIDAANGIYVFKNNLHDLDIEIAPSKISNENHSLAFYKWNGEARLKIVLPFSDSLIEASTETGRYKIRLPGADCENLFYPKSAGDFEWEIVLFEKPESNILKYAIETNKLRFFYQDPDTFEAHKNDWDFKADIPGSYAVYYSGGKNNQYRIGKAFHIYRPRAWNNDGDTVWCDLHVDTVANMLSISIPRDFLNHAGYPVVVDPTFGCTTKGGTGISMSAHNFRHLVNYNDYEAANGNLQTAYICAYKNSQAAACTATVIVYTYSNTLGNCLNIATSNKIEISKFAITPDSGAWLGASISGTLEDDEEYIVSWQGKESCDYCLRVCADYTGIWGYERYADYANWGTNANLAGYYSNGYIYSVYVEYDEGGQPESNPFIRTRKLKRSQ